MPTSVPDFQVDRPTWPFEGPDPFHLEHPLLQTVLEEASHSPWGWRISSEVTSATQQNNCTA